MAGSRWGSRLTQYEDDNGAPLSGGFLYFYLTGTTTPEPTYSDVGLDPGDENPNPITLDADGRSPVDIFLDNLVVYRVRLTNASGTIIAQDDPVAGSDVAAAIAAHNADPDAHLDATESQRGMVELANNTEVQTGTDTDRAVTPAGLASLTSTLTRRGLIELATGAEVETGTDADRAVSPLTLQSAQATAAEILTGTDTTHFMGIAAWVANTTVSGTPDEMSMKFPGGYGVKVGKRTSTQDAPETFTFAAAFSTAIYGVFLQLIDPNDSKALGLDTATPPTVTGFTIDRDSGFAGSKDFYFLAWGK